MTALLYLSRFLEGGKGTLSVPRDFDFLKVLQCVKSSFFNVISLM